MLALEKDDGHEVPVEGGVGGQHGPVDDGPNIQRIVVVIRLDDVRSDAFLGLKTGNLFASDRLKEISKQGKMSHRGANTEARGGGGEA